MTATPPPLTEIVDGTLRWNFHAGQMRAFDSTARFIGVVAGTQSGKTSFMPIWLYHEMQRRGPGDYAIITPTFALLELKALPEFRRLFEQTLRLGRYFATPVHRFPLSDDGARQLFGYAPNVPTTVYFGHAMNPDSLESATYKAAVLDEAGQDAFKRESWEAILRRLSIHRGRALITTTPYHSHGWLRTEIFDKAAAGDPDVELVQFASTMNPAFPREEFERARRDLPAWKFDLFYQGVLTRPPGAIYDSFDQARHVVPTFAIPPQWRRYLGLDFGGVHTAALLYAEEPQTGRLFLYREYLAGGRTAKEHVAALLDGEPMLPLCVGGSHSEDQWRAEFKAGGLPVREPDIKEVELGIERVYGAHKRGEIIVLSHCTRYLEQKQSYRRVLDAAGEPTEKIADKETYHLMDAERYIVGWLKRGARAVVPAVLMPHTSTWRGH